MSVKHGLDDKIRFDQYHSFHTYVDPATRTSIDRALPKPDTMLIKTIEANTTMISRAVIVFTAVQTITGARRRTTTKIAIRPRLVLFMTVLVVMCTFGSLDISLKGDPCQAVQ